MQLSIGHAIVQPVDFHKEFIDKVFGGNRALKFESPVVFQRRASVVCIALHNFAKTGSYRASGAGFGPIRYAVKFSISPLHGTCS